MSEHSGDGIIVPYPIKPEFSESGQKVLIWDGVEPTEAEWLELEHSIPITHFEIEGKRFQIHRCKADGGIVTEVEQSLKTHPGHQVSQPVLIKREEVMALVKGIIPS